MELLHWGLHPAASSALRAIEIDPRRIVQTIGFAAASGGTHAQDGATMDGPYCAATDFSVLHPHHLSPCEIGDFLQHLAAAGFACWYRWPGHDHWPFSDCVHIHAVYAGCAMKEVLRHQIHDFCHGLNGLASHTTYGFWHPSDSHIETVRALFLAHNPPEN